MNRREFEAEGAPVAWEFGGFRLEPRRRLVTGPGGAPISITSKAYDALCYLVQHAGQLVPRSALNQALWPTTIVEDNNLNQAIAALRRALGDGHIVTVPGRGYQFVTPVTALTALPEAPAAAVVGSNPPRELAGPAAANAGATTAAAAEAPQPAPAQQSRSAPERETRRGAASLGSGGPSTGSRQRNVLVGVMVGAAALVGLATVLYMARAPRGSSAPLGTVTRITPLTTFPGNESSPTFAPDGVRIAFAWSRDTTATDIYVTQPGGAEPIRLTHESGMNRDPSWSPDGTRIAFLRQRDPKLLDLIVMPALGGAERTLRPVQMSFISREGSPLLAWTPDSKELLFTTQSAGNAAHELTVWSFETGSSRPLGIKQAPADYDTSPALSPDGKHLAFVRYAAGQRVGRVMLQDLAPGLVPTGEPREIPGLARNDLPHSPSWSADSQLLRFAMGTRIMEWDGRGLRVVQTLAAQIGSMAMVHASSGTRAAVTVINSDEDIWAVPLNPQTHTAAGAPSVRAKSTSAESHPRFSPDGRQLAFISARSGRPAVWIADAHGESPRQVTSLDTLITGFPRWSPDGRRIAFHTSGADGARDIFIVDVNEGAPRRLGPGCCPNWWSADGRFLYVGAIGPTNNIARMSVEDGTRETLFEGDLAVEAADGKRILYSKVAENGIFTRSLEGDPARNAEVRLVEDYTPTLGGTVPVASGFYYLGHTPEGRPRAFRYYDYATKKAWDVASAPGGVSIGLTVSPDESELLYSADQQDAGADLVLLEF